MEHTWARIVHPVLTPFRLRSLLSLCRTGESKVATDPELLERPARSKSKAKAPVRKRRGPTIASLKDKVQRARQGNDGPDIGAMSRAEREKVLFGT